jgi:monovalent cation:proton antiporter-2 (CPA2) family protein
VNGSFLFQAFIYLAAAVVMVPLAKRFGLGSVLGYLLAGVVIGRYGLGLVGHEGEDVMHFAEFGVVMMLFVVGLELDPRVLWRMRGPVLGLGGLQVLITAVVLSAVGRWLTASWPAAIAIGLAGAMSSTALVLQLHQEKGLQRTAAGQSGFAILLAQDLAVIPILALLPLLAHAPDSAPAVAPWLRGAVVIGAVTLLIVAGRYLVGPVLRAVAGTRLRELFVAAALLLVFGIALLMEKVGLSPALGTFVGGVVLANSEFRHELQSDIDPFKGLLLGIFFIAVGASIDWGLVAQHPGFIGAIVVTVLAVKFVVLLVLGRLFGMGRDESVLLAFSLPQVGEFAFVLLGVAAGLGLITADLESPLAAAVALTMGLTPLLFLLWERVVAPRMAVASGADLREADDITGRGPVIIAGFDAFGSTAGRLLRAQGVQMVVLDNDSDRVELVRRLGFPVFYGDPTRLDLLRSAGAEESRLIIVALAEPERNIELVQTIQKHFPNLTIFARALDRGDASDLINLGVPHVYRETVDSSLRLGVDVLRALGARAYQASRAARKFQRYDERNLRELAPLYRDRDAYILGARERIAQLERLLEADRNIQMTDTADDAWDAESLRDEFGARRDG